MNNFQDDLAFAEENGDLSMWEEVYRNAFPDFESMARITSNGVGQQRGVDRVVVLTTGKTIRVDEKIRRVDWPDIALEYLSSIEHSRKGWILKKLDCDYIAYAFEPSRICYLLPFQQLRLAWINNHLTWQQKAFSKREGFKIVDAKNPGYTTRSIAVPIPVLMKSIADAMLVTWRATQRKVA